MNENKNKHTAATLLASNLGGETVLLILLFGLFEF